MKGKKPVIVLASGAFDLVHYGHIYYLEQAKSAGGENTRLVVIVARDKTIETIKGRKPIIPEDQRRAVVEALKPVDVALLGYENLSLIDTIQKIQPSIIAFGYDQEKIEDEVRKVIEQSGVRVKIVKIGRFGSLIFSSSKIKRRILEEWK